MGKCMQCGGMKKATKMKSGGVKKPLRKAQYGDNFQGPVTKKTNEMVNKEYAKSTGPRVYDQDMKDADELKRLRENYDRIPKEKKGGAVKKMAKGGSTLSGSAIKKAPTYMYGMPQENMGTSGQYGMMKKGGAKKSFPDMSGDGKVTAKDILMAKGVIKKPKAKFGATVKVQRSPKAGKVTAVGRGYAAVGKREPGRIIKKTISKKK